jgi:hypothetical protein
VVDSLAGVKSLLGHERRFDLVPTTFGLPRQTDILNIRLNVSNGSMLSKNTVVSLVLLSGGVFLADVGA